MSTGSACAFETTSPLDPLRVLGGENCASGAAGGDTHDAGALDAEVRQQACRLVRGPQLPTTASGTGPDRPFRRHVVADHAEVTAEPARDAVPAAQRAQRAVDQQHRRNAALVAVNDLDAVDVEHARSRRG